MQFSLDFSIGMMIIEYSFSSLSNQLIVERFGLIMIVVCLLNVLLVRRVQLLSKLKREAMINEEELGDDV